MQRNKIPARKIWNIPPKVEPWKKLIFKEGAIREIAKKAINKKTGARGLRSIIEALLLKTMFNLPTMNDPDEVIINESVVKNNSEPIITHSKIKKTSAA